MHEAGRVGLAEILAHGENILAAAGLIAAGPDDDGRMVLVAFEHGLGSI